MNDLNARLASLGIAIAGQEPSRAADPEDTILEAVKHFAQERKLLSLILGWLGQYGDLVHIARLRVLAGKLNAEELAWLGGLALRLASRDRRWQTIVAFVEKKLGSGHKQFHTNELDLLLARRKGKDADFAKFGLIIPKNDQAPEKKFYNRARVLTHHRWLRLRVLFGANWRADIAWQMLKDQKQTPYRIAKELGCNIETAYRNWKALQEVGLRNVLTLS